MSRVGQDDTPGRLGGLGGLFVDAAAVMMFAAIGRRSHDEADGLDAVLATAAPFLVALLLAWIVIAVVWQLRTGRRPDWLAVDTGIGVWVITAGVGLAARRMVWDRGTALSFVIVTAIVLGVLIVGWRVAYRWWRKH